MCEGGAETFSTCPREHQRFDIWSDFGKCTGIFIDEYWNNFRRGKKRKIFIFLQILELFRKRSLCRKIEM